MYMSEYVMDIWFMVLLQQYSIYLVNYNIELIEVINKYFKLFFFMLKMFNCWNWNENLLDYNEYRIGSQIIQQLSLGNKFLM